MDPQGVVEVDKEAESLFLGHDLRPCEEVDFAEVRGAVEKARLLGQGGGGVQLERGAQQCRRKLPRLERGLTFKRLAQLQEVFGPVRVGHVRIDPALSGRCRHKPATLEAVKLVVNTAVRCPVQRPAAAEDGAVARCAQERRASTRGARRSRRCCAGLNLLAEYSAVKNDAARVENRALLVSPTIALSRSDQCPKVGGEQQVVERGSGYQVFVHVGRAWRHPAPNVFHEAGPRGQRGESQGQDVALLLDFERREASRERRGPGGKVAQLHDVRRRQHNRRMARV
mmetsp:Transcript_26960/g.85756  ORF Transcript_26960/g.85756 Transcript_26960/m.85756 type:complete len:284 (-) Transcript_26960:653-1504(-)